MKLELNPASGAFILRVPRRTHADRVQELMNEHGFDFSVPASSPETAVLFTKEPYAAVTFFEHATPEAKAALAPLAKEIEKSWAPTGSGNYRMPYDKELWGFQRANLDYALQRKHSLIGDEPGLGKTPTAIVYANEIRAKRVLVLCPANIRLQWVARIRDWATDLSFNQHVHCILNGKHGAHDGAAWTVCSYDLARHPSTHAALARSTYDLLICDEAHYLKTVDSQRTRAVFGGGRDRISAPLAERAEHVLALSGTPLPNRPREAYTLARGLCFDAIDWMSEDKFSERFNPSVQVNTRRKDGSEAFYIDERNGRCAELQNRLRANFMSRHLKRQVMTQLKLPLYDIIQLDVDGPIKAALKAESMLDIDPEDLSGADAETLGHVAVVRRQMGIAMAPQVGDYVDMLLQGGEPKLVVFAWHIEVLNILEQRLQKWGVRRIDGSTNTKRRQTIVDDFQKEPGIRILIGNIQSMGVGVDGLQHVCSHALIAEASWTPGDNQQAFDRLDRGGQRQQVQCDVFAVPGSFAEKVLAASLRKNRVLHTTLDKQFKF